MEKERDKSREPLRKRLRLKKTAGDCRMSLVSHLEEFRRRLMTCIVCFFAAMFLCLGRAEWMTERLMEKAVGFQFVYIAPAELVLSYIRLALIGGAALACPVILYQCWSFIRPGLMKKERQACFVVLTFGLLLFIVGAAFAFEIVLPITLLFFVGLNPGQSIAPMVSIESYISFMSTTLVTFGVIFELPIVVLMLTKIGILNPEMLRKNRKYVILAVFAVAAFITPPDVTSQILVAFPMLLLFEISLSLSGILFRRKLKNRKNEEVQGDGTEDRDAA